MDCASVRAEGLAGWQGARGGRDGLGGEVVPMNRVVVGGQSCRFAGT